MPVFYWLLSPFTQPVGVPAGDSPAAGQPCVEGAVIESE
jgi:hypothetical protein